MPQSRDPLFGPYAILFFLTYCPNRGPRGRRRHLCVLLTRCSSIWKWVWVGQGLILASPLQNSCLCWFVLCWSVTGLCGCTHGQWEPWDSATSPHPLFCRGYHTTFPCVTMADMRASSPLAPLSVAAGWRNRDIPPKKWQCPCGKVQRIVQNLDSKAYSVHCSGTQHTDWVRYGKVVPVFFHGSISADTPLLGMLIRVDKHLQLLGAVPVASTLAAACAAAVVRLGPIPQVPNLDVDYAMDMDPDLDAAIPLRERKCPGVLLRQAGTLQQLRRMYPVMRGNYEKPPWEFCDRRGLFALDCRTDGRWDDLAGRYGPCLPCLDLLSGKHAARLNG